MIKNKSLLLAIVVLIFSINSFAQNHIIGERFGGGIVFYVDNSGQHGLIADSLNQKNANWLDANNKCKELSDGGYTDWRLPSRDEIELLCDQQKQLGDLSWGSLNWTSTEKDSLHIWAKAFLGCMWFSIQKTQTAQARAIRSF